MVNELLFSREYDYALRILRVLSQNELIAAKQICLNEHIPQPFTYKILKKLEKASIVKAYLGTHGGYQLNVPIKSLNMYDVYAAVEGAVYISACMQDGYRCPNNESGQKCGVHKELSKIQDDIMQIMRHRNLEDLFKADNVGDI